MGINKEMKKKVIEDWQNAFPQLTLYAQDKLYKVIGPLIIGLELIKLPRTDDYRPHFVIYSLCGNTMGNDIKACLAGPILSKEYYDKKGFQYNIPYERHSLFFNDVLDNINKQTPLLLDNNVSLKKIISVLDDYSTKPPLSAAPNSYLQASLQEVKLKIALFIGVTEAQNIFNLINKKNWDMKSFNMWNIDIEKWLKNLQEVIANREEFLKRIEINKQDKKIVKLQSSELLR